VDIENFRCAVATSPSMVVGGIEGASFQNSSSSGRNVFVSSGIPSAIESP